MSRYLFFSLLCFALTTLLVPTTIRAASRTNAVAPAGGGGQPPASIKTPELVRLFNSAVSNHDYKAAFQSLSVLRSRKETAALPPEGVLTTLYRQGQGEDARKWLKAHQELLSRPGEHRLIISYLFYDAGEWDQFFLHVIASLETAERHQQRILNRALTAFGKQDYSAALSNLSAIQNSRFEKLNKRLTAYIHIKRDNHGAAYQIIKDLYSENTTVPPVILRLLFHLALSTRSGTESVYWGRSLLKSQPGVEKDSVFINNYCLALSMQFKKAPAGDKAALKKEILAKTERLIQLKRDANALHTASIAYATIDSLRKAVEMIRLCRALDAKNKEYLKRQQMLEKALRSKIRKAGRNR